MCAKLLPEKVIFVARWIVDGVMMVECRETL